MNKIKNMANKVADWFRQLQVWLLITLRQMQFRLADERGDTNFISIAIILIVVIGIAVLFITLGDTIKTAFTSAVEKLKDALGL